MELAVNSILTRMSAALVDGERIEIRGFGSLSLHYRAARVARNPKTGEKVTVAEKYVPHFKPGANLRKRVNRGLLKHGHADAHDDDADDSHDDPFGAHFSTLNRR